MTHLSNDDERTGALATIILAVAGIFIALLTHNKD